MLPITAAREWGVARGESACNRTHDEKSSLSNEKEGEKKTRQLLMILRRRYAP